MHTVGEITDDQFVGNLKVLARLNDGLEGEQALDVLLSHLSNEYRESPANRAQVLERMDKFALDDGLSADKRGVVAAVAQALRQPDAGILDVYRSIEPKHHQICLDFLQSVIDDETLEPDAREEGARRKRQHHARS